MFKPTTAKTVFEYINMIEEPRRADFKKLHEFICKLLPKDKPYLNGGMIGWRSFHYKSASGREGDWPIVALASQKNYISLYLCAASDGQYIAEKHKADFPKASIGRSCIRFKKVSDIDLSVLEKVILEGLKSGFSI
jgi:hypothetical protein